MRPFYLCLTCGWTNPHKRWTQAREAYLNHHCYTETLEVFIDDLAEVLREVNLWRSP